LIGFVLYKIKILLFLPRPYNHMKYLLVSGSGRGNMNGGVSSVAERLLTQCS